MCVSHSNGIIVVQSGGRTSRETEVLKEKVVAHGRLIHRMGNVTLVSKNPFSLNLLPLSGAVWWYVDNHSICSYLVVTMTRNTIIHDTTYLLRAVVTQRNIHMGWRIPGPCLLEVSHGIMYKLCMGQCPLVRGHCGLSGEVEDCKQAWLVVLAINILKH